MTATRRVPVSVIKLGGSLLDLPDWPQRLAEYLAIRSDRRIVLIAGGGAPADQVRRWDEQHSLGEVAAHALAMQTLDITASLAAQLLPGARSCRLIDEVDEAWQDGALTVIRPHSWFQSTPGWFCGEPRLPCGLLPQSWDVTSDSLAACVAIDLDADELVLLKSVDLPCGCNYDDAAEAGLVDRFFPTICPHLSRIRWVNLRERCGTP